MGELFKYIHGGSAICQWYHKVPSHSSWSIVEIVRSVESNIFNQYKCYSVTTKYSIFVKLRLMDYPNKPKKVCLTLDWVNHFPRGATKRPNTSIHKYCIFFKRVHYFIQSSSSNIPWNMIPVHSINLLDTI